MVGFALSFKEKSRFNSTSPFWVLYHLSGSVLFTRLPCPRPSSPVPVHVLLVFHHLFQVFDVSDGQPQSVNL